MKKAEINKLDKIFSLKIRSKGYCEKCGSDHYLQCSHIWSRRYQNTRWHVLNALALCAKCHRWAHDKPMEFAEFVKTLRTEKELEELKLKANEISKGLTYGEVMSSLEGKC